jgi:HAD superfamily hydrolase (TIGR01509 family)
MLPKALLFDLDGVLVDFADLHERAFIEAWNGACPAHTIDHAFHALYLEARSTRSKIAICYKIFSMTAPEPLTDTIFAAKQSLTDRLLDTEPVYTATTRALLWAAGAGYKLAVCSNSIRSTVMKSLRRLAIADIFNVILSNEDVKLPKPSPEIYLKAMEQLGVVAEDCIIFEDSAVGRQAAEAAGGRVIPVVNAQDITEEFLKAICSGSGSPYPSLPAKINLVIPMAGLGSRFQKEGYTVPKPFLPVFGKPMYRWVIDNMIPAKWATHFDVHVLVREEQAPLFESDKGIKIHTVPCLTEGAACTVLTIRDIINTDAPLVIANSDQFLEWDAENFYLSLLHPGFDGVISTFIQPDLSDVRWSYARLDADRKVVEVAEKKVISNFATTGIYGWSRGSAFVAAAEEMIAANVRVNGEFYVCPVYNHMPAAESRIRVHNCKKMWGLGVPKDYEYFLSNFK